MTILKGITLFIYAALLPTTVLAEDYVRNGNPCLSGICVGDEISTLTQIPWKTAIFDALKKPVLEMKITDADVKNLLADFAPNAAAAVKEAAPYLKFGTFDERGIPKLAKISGFCSELKSMGVIGYFRSEGGHETTVFVNVVPGAGPSSQSLRVTQIERRFPSEYTSAQVSELNKQLEERYGAVKKTNPTSNPTWEFVPYERKLTLRATMGKLGQYADQLKQYPKCGKTLTID